MSEATREVPEVIGIAIPTLNAAEYLEEALVSLRRQERVQVRIVVADSGSTDGTLELCAAAGIPTVYVPRGNMYRAINAGIRELDTEWVGYLNADDYLFRDAHARLLAVAMAGAAEVSYGASDFIDPSGRFQYALRPPPVRDLGVLFDRAFFGFPPHCAVFTRRLFDAVGGFSEEYRHIADMDFYARAEATGARFARVAGDPVGVFRLSPNQLSRREADIVEVERQRFLQQRAPTRRAVGALALWRWKLANGPNYIGRMLRTGSWRGFGRG